MLLDHEVYPLFDLVYESKISESMLYEWLRCKHHVRHQGTNEVEALSDFVRRSFLHNYYLRIYVETV